MELQDYYFFNELSEDEFNEIKKEAKFIKAPIGTILYYKGDINEAILFLKRGKVKIYLQPESIDKSEITLYHISAGEQCLVNTLSTITQNETMASALVEESIEGWLIPRETILWLIDNSKSYRDFKIELCSDRVHKLINLINSIKFEQLEQRILNWLFVQGKDKIKITHEAMANFLGVSRESISRNLKKLENSGILKLSRGSITLLMLR